MNHDSLRLEPQTTSHRTARFLPLAALAALVTLATACGGTDDIDPNAITYYKDVKPILDAKCVGCHQAGGVAPFALDTYELASVYAGSSKLAVSAGTMPPWQAADECNDYVAVRALHEDHKQLFLDWVDGGTLEGDPADEGAPLEVEVTSLSRVDSTLTMAESYMPVSEPGRYDDYRCFILPWPETTTKYVTGFEAHPGNLQVAHHAIAFLAQPEDAAFYEDLDASEPGPGWQCFGGTGGPSRQWLGAWAPGGQGQDLPADVGLEVLPGSLVVLQMHYNTLNQAGAVSPDLTSLDFKLEDQVAKPGYIQPWANPQWVLSGTMNIPPNQDDVEHSFALDPTVLPFSNASKLEIYNAGLHMHLLGTRARLSIERADGTSTCLLQIDDWDFDWQGSYRLRTSEVLNSGDQLRVECHYDNTLANQPMENGQPRMPQEVNWGEDSTDEMCLGIVLVTVE